MSNIWGNSGNRAYGVPMEFPLPLNPNLPGQYLAWDIVKQLLVYTPGTGGGGGGVEPAYGTFDAAIPYPASSIGAAIKTALAGGGGGGGGGTTNAITHTQPGAGGTTRYLNTVLNDMHVSVKSFGALGNNIADDTVAIRACFNYCMANGRTAFFPPGTYLVTSGLVIDSGAPFSQFNNRMTVIGAGSANTRIRMASGNFTMLTWGGTGAERHVRMSGLYLQGPAVIDEDNTGWVSGGGTSIGMVMRGWSYATVDDVNISGFGIGLKVDNTLNTMFSNCYINSNIYGVQLLDGIYTHVNAVTFTSCKIAGNANYAILADLVQVLTITGGSIEANGIGGADANKYGMLVNIGTDGVCAFNINGTYFEGNKGIADLRVEGANLGASSLVGCTFNRLSNIDYTTNNIAVSAMAGRRTELSVLGCGFAGFNTYVASAARKYIVILGGEAHVTWSGCYFQNSAEAPTMTGNVPVTTGYSQLLIQGGGDAGTYGIANVTFPVPFKAGSSVGVFLQAYGDTTTGTAEIPVIKSTSATGCVIVKKRADGTLGDYSVMWYAVGERA